MPASFPGSIKNFGSDRVDGDYIPAADVNEIRAEVVAVETELAAKGVTNGNSHDHNGGDGAQISHGNLSGAGSNTHAQIDIVLSTLASGTYTPNLYNTTNVAGAAVIAPFFYLRVGSVVHVAGSLTIDPTAAVATVLGIDLPIPSAFSSQAQLAGIGHNTVDESARLQADVANDRVSMQWTAVNISSLTWYIVFTYRIL